MTYVCCDRQRRDRVANHATLNGIDYLEVLDNAAPPGIPRQQTLLVRCLKNIVPTLSAANVTIRGGEAGHQVHVVWAAPATGVPLTERAFFSAMPDPGALLVIRTDARGDFSVYTLDLVTSPSNPTPPQNFDPQLVHVEFSFKVECPSDFDCKKEVTCQAPPADGPGLDYLAKDYSSFRRLLIDLISQRIPDWRERTAADQIVTLLELLAYIGDRLSYEQDAIATEAYLGTARRRVSLRRHALLADYHIHDGRNARAWVVVQLDTNGAADGLVLPKGVTQFLTRVPGSPQRLDPASEDFTKAMGVNPTVFESVHDLTLRNAHAELHLYSWQDRRCCLPLGATSATLRGHLPTLEVGHVLVFEEIIGPRTGEQADADPTHRHAVRLKTANCTAAGGGHLTDPLMNGQEITEISWEPDDALPFPVCVSSQADEAHQGIYLQEVTVVRGNVVLVDHGRTIADEPLGSVPRPALFARPTRDDRCNPPPRVPLAPRFRPLLSASPLTHTVRLADGSATAVINTPPGEVIPAVSLTGMIEGSPEPWHAERDLLRSDNTERAFVVETEHDGSARLRFGDGVHGYRPRSTTQFSATYRVGNGRAGNVGAEAIFHVVTSVPGIVGARNPLPADGGFDPETTEEIRRRAPEAFRTQERAVTRADYAEIVRRYGPTDIQRAVASLRWTGSWHTVFITADAMAGHTVDRGGLRRFVERYRMAGHDLEFDDPRWVSLEITLLICVRPDYFRSQVRAALLEVFTAGLRSDGQLGLFHPDRFTFGQTVYLSPLYAAAHDVAGVASVEITQFQRQGIDTREYLVSGRLPLGPLEVARLENDPSQPEHGLLRLEMRGGT